MANCEHFGVTIRIKKLGLKLTRDNYAIISKKVTTLEHCPNYCEIYCGESRLEEF